MRRQLIVYILLAALGIGATTPNYAYAQTECDEYDFGCQTEVTTACYRSPNEEGVYCEASGYYGVAASILTLGGYLIYENWDDIKDAVSKSWDGIKDAANAVWDFIKDVGNFLCFWCDDEPSGPSEEQIQEAREAVEQNRQVRDRARDANDQLLDLQNQLNQEDAESSSNLDTTLNQSQETNQSFEQNSIDTPEDLITATDQTEEQNNNATNGIDLDVDEGWDDTLGYNPEFGQPIEIDPPDWKEDYDISVPRDTPEGQRLIESKRLIHESRETISNGGLNPEESQAVLDMAEQALNAAELAYEANDQEGGNTFMDAFDSVVDFMDDVAQGMMDIVKDQVSMGSSFIAGTLHGATGISLAPMDGYENFFYAGQAMGSVAGLVGDASLVITGFTAASGGYGITLSTGGTLAPVGAVAVAAGSALSATGGLAMDFHWMQLRKAINLIGSGGGGPAFKSFTSGHFKENLVTLTGKNPAGHQAHHMLPQKFRELFKKAGINCDNPRYGSWWWLKGADGHLRKATEYNRKMGEFLNSIKPIGPQHVEDILNYARELAEFYKQTIYF